MKKYKVLDIYDGIDLRETLGYADNIREIKKLAKERIKDTDGECLVAYLELDTTKNKYRLDTIVIL